MVLTSEAVSKFIVTLTIHPIAYDAQKQNSIICLDSERTQYTSLPLAGRENPVFRATQVHEAGVTNENINFAGETNPAFLSNSASNPTGLRDWAKKKIVTYVQKKVFDPIKEKILDPIKETATNALNKAYDFIGDAIEAAGDLLVGVLPESVIDFYDKHVSDSMKNFLDGLGEAVIKTFAVAVIAPYIAAYDAVSGTIMKITDMLITGRNFIKEYFYDEAK